MMDSAINNNQAFFDCNFPDHEQLPRRFYVSFEEYETEKGKKVAISIDGKKLGNTLSDNSYIDDGYRYHDIFHLSHAAVLGWSPCLRKMLKRKRKSDYKVDEVEDGARAMITEEAIAFFVYHFAREVNFLDGATYLDSKLLDTVKKLSSDLEVKSRTTEDWENAILQGYSAFRQLRQNKGGLVKVDLKNKKLSYIGKNLSLFEETV